MSSFGPALAHHGGWYENSHAFQTTFVMAVGLVGVMVVSVRARAASFHHVDVKRRTLALGPDTHKVLDLTGIVVVIIAALLAQAISVSKYVA